MKILKISILTITIIFLVRVQPPIKKFLKNRRVRAIMM